MLPTRNFENEAGLDLALSKRSLARANRELMRGARDSCSKTVRGALAAGANPIQWNDDEPVMRMALRKSFDNRPERMERDLADIINALLDAGANVNADSHPETGRPALTSALSWLCHLPVRKELAQTRRRIIKGGANPNWRFGNGGPILHELARWSYRDGLDAEQYVEIKREAARDLLKAGVDWSAKTIKGKPFWRFAK